MSQGRQYQSVSFNPIMKLLQAVDFACFSSNKQMPTYKVSLAIKELREGPRGRGVVTLERNRVEDVVFLFFIFGF